MLVNGQTTWFSGSSLIIMAGLTALTIALVVLVPKITKAIPASLVAILVVFGIVLGFNIDTKTVKDTLNTIFPCALIMAGVGLTEGRVAEMSGIDALNKLTERYRKANKNLHLKHLSPDCRELLKNAQAIIDVNIMEDPEYHVA